MAFPEKMFGKCPVCGGGGKNDPDPGSAFSTEDHAGVGYRLYNRMGKVMCRMCYKRLRNDAQSIEMNRKYQENQTFLERMGVKKTMDR